jgi:hypothetical protein
MLAHAILIVMLVTSALVARCSIMTGLTVHLALVGEDDLAPTARGVDCQRLLEALFDVWTPYSFCVRRGQILRTPFHHPSIKCVFVEILIVQLHI